MFLKTSPSGSEGVSSVTPSLSLRTNMKQFEGIRKQTKIGGKEHIQTNLVFFTTDVYSFSLSGKTWK